MNHFPFNAIGGFVVEDWFVGVSVGVEGGWWGNQDMSSGDIAKLRTPVMFSDVLKEAL